MPTLTIARRELRAYFDSPLAYVVICLTFISLGLMFFLGMNREGFWKADKATMETLFYYLAPGIGVLVVPVLTMRLMAEERRSGTLEMLITLPVRDADVILGKYLGALAVTLVLIVATLVYPVCLFGWPFNLGALDWNTVFSGYLGVTLLAAACVAVGLLISSLTDSQPVAFFLSFAILGALFAAGYMAENGEGWLVEVVNYISFSSRIRGFARGLIDTRDIVFFLTITVLSLMVSFRALERRKWA